MQSNQLAERGLPGRDFADTAESSLDSIPEDRSTSRHHDLARRHILLQQRRAMQEVIERVGNSSITDSSFSEKESSDYAAETNESSRNIFGHFNSSSSSLPQEFPTTTTQTNNLKQVLPKALSLRNLLASETRALSLRNLFASGTRALSLRKLFASETKESSSNCIFDHFNWSSSSLPYETSTRIIRAKNLRPVEAQDNKGSQRVTTKARAEKKSSRKSRSKSPERSIPKREHTKGMLGRMVWPRDLSERNVSPSEDDQSKATRRSNQRSKKSGKLLWGKKQQASNEE